MCINKSNKITEKHMIFLCVNVDVSAGGKGEGVNIYENGNF